MIWFRDFSLSRPLKIFEAGLIVFSISLPLSNFGMSLGQIIMLLAWILDGEWQRKVKDFLRTPKYFVWSLFFLFYLFSFVHGGDLDYGLNDARVKMPFLILPLIFSGFNERLSKALIFRALWSFAIAVVVSFLVSLLFYYEVMGLQIPSFKRYSPFVSHIRLSLMGVLAICFFFSRLENQRRSITHLYASVFSMFLSVVMVQLAWFSGLFVLGVVLFLFSINQFLNRRGSVVQRFIWILPALSPFIFGILLMQRNAVFFSECKVSNDQFLEKTRNGRFYEHHPEYGFCENGHPFGLNIQWEELHAAYLARTGKSTDELGPSGWKTEMTLMRYLTSRNLTKDSVGVYSLSESDLMNIQKGIPNYLLSDKNVLEKKIYEFSVEWQSIKGGFNPSGHSLSMRLFAWKRAFSIISESPLTGHGLCNVAELFRQSYEKEPSPIDPSKRIRAHNQYLTLGIALGIPLGLLTIFMLFWVPVFMSRNLPEVYFFFWLVPIISMFFEDTLETQAGVSMSLFAFLIWIPLQGSGIRRLKTRKSL